MPAIHTSSAHDWNTAGKAVILCQIVSTLKSHELAQTYIFPTRAHIIRSQCAPVRLEPDATLSIRAVAGSGFVWPTAEFPFHASWASLRLSVLGYQCDRTHPHL